MKKVLVLFAAFFLLVSFAAVAQEDSAEEQADMFAQLDADEDGSLNEEEIGTAYEEYTQTEGEYLGVEDVRQKLVSEGYMQEWDTDDDGQLSKEEFVQGALSAFDENGNGTLEKEEIPEIQESM